MSCQQVSRFITTTPSIININTTVPKTAVAAAASLTLTAPETTATTSTTAAAVSRTTPTAGAEAALVSIKATTAIAVSTALSTTTSSIASLTAATAEDQDPYVFTESVHATPPVHFNAQKSRIRHADTAAITQSPPTTTTTTATTTIEIETDTIPVATTTTTNVDDSATTKITTTTTTTKAASAAPAAAAVEVTTTTTAATTAVTNCNGVSTVTTTSTSTVIAVTSTSPVKNGTQQQQQQPQQQQQNVKQLKRQSQSKSPLLLTTTPLSPTLAVRVQEQQQQQQHTKILSPTCGLQLTPSLWQTPLLLDTNSSSNNNNNNNNNNSSSSSSNTIPTTNFNNINVNKNNNNNITSINGNNFTNVTTVNGTHVTINSPMHSPTAVTAALMANITHSAIPLPPSNFHHTTLAQHLQKVECIKKPPKRQNLNPMCIATHKAIMTPPATPPIITTATSPVLLPPLQPLNTSIEQIQQQQQQKLALNKENIQFSTGEDKQQQNQQQLKQKLPDEHSDTDLNEIPVNVIFRKPQPATAPVINKTTTITTTTSTTTTEKHKPHQTFEPPKLVTIIASPMKQQQQQLSKPTLIMPCTKVDIDAAVSTLQSMQFNALQEENSCNVQQQQQKEEGDNVEHVTTENKNKTISNQTPANKQKLDLTKTTSNNNNSKRSRGKQTVILPSLNQNSLAADHGSAVAVVKMSSTELSADISDLANATVLPYVVQKHWLTAEYPQKQLISREERIAQSKNLLRRQALQLLNTHSLQKLPLQAARKRLICVDRLLRKYGEEQLHTDRFYHSNKLCHTAGCQNRALEMTSHCWQHITQNSTQQIFQTCAALDAKNSQCVTPVFDILHEVPLCELHEKQREMYELKLKNNNNNNNNNKNNNNNSKVKVNATNNCVNVAKQKQYKHNSDLLQIQQQQQQQQQPKQIILQQQMPQLQKLHINNKININNNNNNNNNNNIINNNNNNKNQNVINIKPVKAQTAATTTTTRKRKTQLVNEVARAPKRGKKCVATPPLVAATTTTKTQQQPLPRLNVNSSSTNLTKAMIANTSIMLSSVAPAPSPPPPLLQRKSSTTSLESIGSTSYNSASPPQHCYSYYSELQQQQQQQHQQQQQQQQQAQQTQNQLNYVNTVPALAPLSFGFSNPFVNSTNATNATNNNSSHSGNSSSIHTANINNNSNNNNNNNNNHHHHHHIGSSIMFNANLNATISAADLKEHEINQIVSQFTMLHNNQTLNSNGHNIIGTNGSNNNNNNNSNNHHHQIIFNSYNNTSNSNLNFLNTNSDSNFTSALSTDELLTQDMMSICENSSAYASSEDTGLGGLSETELIAAHDEDIPLGDTRLLEEHDLANVLSALPDDAFNELFTAVRQDERDEVERALELADKHLKSLQQTIGSGTSESDFLGDFLDVNDEILADTDDICGKMDMASVMHSPETSGIDTSAMFIENSSGGMSTHSTASGTSLSSTSSSSASSLTNSACANNNGLADMRGLVRT